MDYVETFVELVLPQRGPNAAPQSADFAMDRGFLFGDGVYEVMAQVDGRIRAKSLHARRLQSSLDSIDLEMSIEQVFATLIG